MNVGGNVVRDQRGNADSEVDIKSVLQFLSGALRHLLTRPCHYFASRVVRFSMRFDGWGLCTMRCTKIPGV
jgi:hypothetical protein